MYKLNLIDFLCLHVIPGCEIGTFWNFFFNPKFSSARTNQHLSQFWQIGDLNNYNLTIIEPEFLTDMHTLLQTIKILGKYRRKIQEER